ncbi:MAG: ArsA-related P-loop ATPase [Myxococcota bacterium]|nr:ArsA-related P-loop ATPase [Myxococcota bacterium]
MSVARDASSLSLEGSPSALVESELLLLLGSGGVGKTTCSAALALCAAHHGRRVLLLTIDPAQRLAAALGTESIAGSPMPLEGAPGLEVATLDRRAVSDALVRRHAPSAAVAEEILSDRLYQAFSGRLAGVQEYMAAVEIEAQLRRSVYDLVIVDTPPSQHALDLLDGPKRLQRALSSPALSWLQGGWRQGGAQLALKALARVSAVEFLDELNRFLQLFSQVLRGLEVDSGALIERLRSPHAQSVLIATTRKSTLEAALLTERALQDRGLGASLLVMNRSPYPLSPWSTEKERSASALLETLYPAQEVDEILSFWRKESQAQARQRATLRAAFNALPPLVELRQRGDGLPSHEALRALAMPLWEALTEGQRKLSKR